ncbi:MAG: exodeoxyribonuclease VII large subunit [Acidobacteria bacterium]|nr:exodeoxyribonuclease VII large subunit [Acidobacteriota bacterium]
MSLLELLINQPQAISVSELNAQIKDLLEREFYDILVTGEISNFKAHSSGHWYFTLKDEFSQIRCALFRQQNLYIRPKPTDGLKVRLRARVSLYESRGDYQLVVSSLEYIGKGDLQKAFEALQAKLLAEGLFDTVHKKPLPKYPLLIGIVTSHTGAAIQDILQVLYRRNKSINVVVYSSKVQGDGAAEEIAEGINYFNTRQDIDVLIVGRGGGSIEDLWPFNEEIVARAIFASRIPVISAVGHEIDFTIADFVADHRAPTPSVAAEIVAARQDELIGLVNYYQETLTQSIEYFLLREKNSLANLRSKPGFEYLPKQISQSKEKLINLTHRLETAFQTQLKKQNEQLALLCLRLATRELRSTVLESKNEVQKMEMHLQQSFNKNLQQMTDKFLYLVTKLESLSPLAVLSRGYALVWTSDNNLVKRPTQVAPGDKVRVQLSEGEIICIRDLE